LILMFGLKTAASLPLLGDGSLMPDVRGLEREPRAPAPLSHVERGRRKDFTAAGPGDGSMARLHLAGGADGPKPVPDNGRQPLSLVMVRAVGTRRFSTRGSSHEE
jgi:hypothetical protein